MNLTDFYMYDSSGRITGVFREDEYFFYLNCKVLNLFKGKANPDKEYIFNGELIDRPKQLSYLDEKKLMLLPDPCEVVVNNKKSYKCFGGEAILDFDQPGNYNLRIIAWPFIDKELDFEN